MYVGAYMHIQMSCESGGDKPAILIIAFDSEMEQKRIRC